MAEWPRFCRTNDFLVEEPDVSVYFPSGRRQRVRVHEEGELLRLESTALGRIAVDNLVSEGDEDTEGALALRILRRNRSAPLVGFRWTPRGKIVVESHVPRLGLSRDEFRLHLMCVAREADWLELLLTGEDRN